MIQEFTEFERRRQRDVFAAKKAQKETDLFMMNSSRMNDVEPDRE